ncbi:MAG TPA: OmpA family protein [Usitatibacteraceae bacterium]|nr:OmpA family protein [Usitatibacteraceae bacterium]
MRLAAAVLVLAVAGCAEAPKAPAPVGAELVAVIPGPDGHVGAVVVHSGGGAQVLDQAFSARRVKPDGSTEAALLTSAEVTRAFGPTIEALPGRPASFVLYFLEGKDELTPASRVELDKVFAELKRRPAPDIVVTGHTDTVGNLAFNDKLSLARAERLREMMVGLGIPPERIQATGRGKRELLVPTDDNTAEPRNRRVEISVR